MHLRHKNTNYLHKTSKPHPRQRKLMTPLPDDSGTIIFCRGFPNEDVPGGRRYPNF